MACFCLLFFWPVFGHTNPAVTFLCTCHNSSTLAPRPLIIHPSPLTTQLQADCHGTDPLIHRSHGLMDFHSFIWVSAHSRNLISLLSPSLHLVFVIVSLKCCMPLPSLIPRAPCADGGLMFDKQQVLFVHSCLPLHADVGFPGHRLIWQRCGLSGRFPDQTLVFKWGSRAHLDLSKGIS